MIMKRLTFLGWYIVGVVTLIALMALAFLAGRWAAGEANNDWEETTDTLIVKDTVRVLDPQPQLVTQEVVKYKYVMVDRVDTLLERDTVIQVKENVAVIPITQKTYTDSTTYRAVVSGYDPRLDEIEIYRENMIVTQVKKERIRWAIGATAGAGLGLFNRQPDVFVGVGVTYNISP